MPNDFQQVVSLLANISTVIALFMAIILYLKWRKQQNYTFIRDHIFDLEKSLSQTYLLLVDAMTKYHSFCELELQNESSSKIETQEKIYQESYNLFLKNSLSYQANYNLLFNINGRHEFFINPIRLDSICPDLDSEFKKFQLFAKNETDIDSLKIYFSNEIQNINKGFVQALVHMGEIRNSL